MPAQQHPSDDNEIEVIKLSEGLELPIARVAFDKVEKFAYIYVKNGLIGTMPYEVLLGRTKYYFNNDEFVKKLEWHVVAKQEMDTLLAKTLEIEPTAHRLSICGYRNMCVKDKDDKDIGTVHCSFRKGVWVVVKLT